MVERMLQDAAMTRLQGSASGTQEGIGTDLHHPTPKKNDAEAAETEASADRAPRKNLLEQTRHSQLTKVGGKMFQRRKMRAQKNGGPSEKGTTAFVKTGRSGESLFVLFFEVRKHFRFNVGFRLGLLGDFSFGGGGFLATFLGAAHWFGARIFLFLESPAKFS